MGQKYTGLMCRSALFTTLDGCFAVVLVVVVVDRSACDDANLYAQAPCLHNSISKQPVFLVVHKSHCL